VAHLPLRSAQQAPASQSGAQAPAASTTPDTPGPRQTPGNSGNAAPPPGAPPPSAGSPGAPIPTSTAPTSKPTQPQSRTFTSAGGTVEAACTADGLARLLSWTPVKPYKVERVDAGPATSATAVFRHGNNTVQMIITCADGVPSATTIPPGG
jgi:serine/threonine-protein kinase